MATRSLPRRKAKPSASNLWAGKKFKAVHLSTDPMKPEACQARDTAVRLAVAVLANSSSQLQALAASAESLDMLRETHDVIRQTREWMENTINLLNSAEARLLSVVAKAFQDHPERLPGSEVRS